MKFKNKKSNTMYVVTTPSLIERFKKDSDYEAIDVQNKTSKKKNSKVESQTVESEEKTEVVE